jgi:hypothetical protein
MASQLYLIFRNYQPDWGLEQWPCPLNKALYVMRWILVTLLSSLALSAAAEEAVATDCASRISASAAPEFPTSVNAYATIGKDGSCSVLVRYSLAEDGTVNVLSAQAAENRCKSFESSAARAVEKTSFTGGSPIAECHYTYSYDFE